MSMESKFAPYLCGESCDVGLQLPSSQLWSPGGVVLAPRSGIPAISK
jgi:hypothetical protein